MAATRTKNILVFGATGLIGEYIVGAILNSKENFDRIAIFTSLNTLWHKSGEINDLKKKGVEVIAGDLTNDSDVNEAYNGIDTVVSCVGRPVIHTQLKLIELAARHPDVKRFFPSEYGTDIEYWPSSAHEKPHQQKLKVRALLKDVKDLDYTYVVTGPYAESYLSSQKPEDEARGSFDVARKRAVLLGDGEGRISLTTMRDVGKLVVAALLHPEETQNRALHVNSFTTTPKQAVAKFEELTKERWHVSYTSLEELKQLEEQAWVAEEPTAGGLTLKRIWTSGGTLYEKRDNHLIGLEHNVDSLEDTVSRAIKSQQ